MTEPFLYGIYKINYKRKITLEEMKITPIEIRQKQFEKAFRGYEKEEVDAFLLSLSQEWERVMEENKELRKRLEITEKEVSRLREVENSLFKTLKNAEDTGAQVIGSAQRTADLHIKEAQMKSEGILNEAKSKARAMVEEAEVKSRETVDLLLNEVKTYERGYFYLEDQKENLLQELKTMINDFDNRIEKYAARSNRTLIENQLKELRSLTYEKPRYNFKEAISSEIKKEIPQEKAPEPEIKKEAAPNTENKVESSPEPERKIETTQEPKRTIEPTFTESDKKDEQDNGSFFDKL